MLKNAPSSCGGGVPHAVFWRESSLFAARHQLIEERERSLPPSRSLFLSFLIRRSGSRRLFFPNGRLFQKRRLLVFKFTADQLLPTKAQGAEEERTLSEGERGER